MTKGIFGMKGDEQRPLVLKTLRAKFIAINMAMAILVLAGTFGVVSSWDYSSRIDTVYSELNYVLTEATTPHAEQLTSTQPLKQTDEGATASGAAASGTNGSAGQTSSTTGSTTASTTENRTGSSSAARAYPTPTSTPRSNMTSSSSNDNQAPIIGAPSGHNDSVVLIAVYEVNPNGIYTVISDYTNATIPESIIINANTLVIASDDSQGWLEDYDLYYMRNAAPDNPSNYLVAYADGSSVNGWRTLALTLTIGGLVALLVFFIINIYFSRWALRPVEMSIKQQQQFTADASHELKTPLTVIIANMAILRSEPDESVGSQMQWIESTQTEAERMQLLVNDMLALSRSENAQKQREEKYEERVDFSDIVEGEVLQFESVAFELGVEMDSAIEEGLIVRGDPERLGRMVATLIDNACKYSSKADSTGTPIEESPEVTITLECRVTTAIRGPVAELKVHNNGPTIPEDDLPHIFTRFYRADKARTSSASKGSYGLGLAIGQQIAVEHDGDISVTSTEDAGTTFTVTLPMMAYEPHEEGGEEDEAVE